MSEKNSFSEEKHVQNPVTYREEEYKKIVRKIDFTLLPFLSLLYLLSFLDRSSIGLIKIEGNARIAGMDVDVHLDGFKFNIVAAVFFMPYAFAEVPSNLCLKLIRPSIWIPSIMVAWGTVVTLTCLCNTYEGLIIARIFLGITEAGLFPGVTYYLSLWYRRRDVALRIAIFFSAATVSGAFGGILAYGITHMEGIGGLHGWQWIFCLEGLATVLVAFIAFFVLHDYPATAKFLTSEERRIVLAALEEDSLGLATHFDKKFIWQTMTDYKTYVQMGIYAGLLHSVYAIALFAPTIVKELGFTAAQAQLLTVPIYASGCIATLAVGYLSDRYSMRGPFLVGCIIVSMIGFIVLYTQNSPGAGYAGAVIAAIGIYPTIAVDVAWSASAVGGDVSKGVVIAMVTGAGNFGAICASFTYITPPRFHIGHGTVLGWLGLSVLLSGYAMWDYNRLNKEREARCVHEGIDESKKEEFRDLGNNSPLFRFTI